jgi:hypothetical protein
MAVVTREIGNACECEVKFTCKLETGNSWKDANRHLCRYFETAPKLKGKCIYRSGNKCNSPWANGSALAAKRPSSVNLG